MAKDNFRRKENGSSREKERLYLPLARVPLISLLRPFNRLSNKVYTTITSFYVRVYLFRILQDHYSAKICEEVLTFLFPNVLTFSCLYASLPNIVHEQAKFLANTQTG